ncbi:hypothetical protein [Kribbella pittospori]|nr:hypothetical protein [Kribbella pittospori]
MDSVSSRATAAIAEYAGDLSPDGMQNLLSRAVWDADAVRDDLRG